MTSLLLEILRISYVWIIKTMAFDWVWFGTIRTVLKTTWAVLATMIHCLPLLKESFGFRSNVVKNLEINKHFRPFPMNTCLYRLEITIAYTISMRRNGNKHKTSTELYTHSDKTNPYWTKTLLMQGHTVITLIRHNFLCKWVY